jgi:hypothetical protein
MRRAFPIAALVVTAVLPAALVVPVGAVHDAGSQFVIELEADGDATVTVVDEYERSNESQWEAFEAIRDDARRQTDRAAAVTDRLRTGAAEASSTTGREMTVSEATVNVTTANATGVVRVRARWTGLAAVDREAGSVQVSEPFASGFEVERPLAVHGPPGFTRASTHPEPGRALKNAAFWAGDRDLDGFRARFTGSVPAPSGTPTATVGPVTVGGLTAFATAAALALVPVLLLAVAFRREPR